MRKRLFDSVVLALCLLLYGYFGWHYYHGPRSTSVLAGIEAKKADLRQQLEAQIEKRRRLEAKVDLLRPEHVDADFLDELARAMLNQTKQEEWIIPK